MIISYVESHTKTFISMMVISENLQIKEVQVCSMQEKTVIFFFKCVFMKNWRSWWMLADAKEKHR